MTSDIFEEYPQNEAHMRSCVDYQSNKTDARENDKQLVELMSQRISEQDESSLSLLDIGCSTAIVIANIDSMSDDNAA